MTVVTVVICDECGAQAPYNDRKALDHWGGAPGGTDLCPSCAPCGCRQHTAEMVRAVTPPPSSGHDDVVC